MKTNIKKTLIALLGAVALVAIPTLQAQPLTLVAPPVNGSTNYFQNFDSLNGSGLPAEWVLYTGASASSVGTIVAGGVNFKGGPTNAWGDTSGAFKNLAGTYSYEGATNYLGSETTTTQTNAANRALGLRPTGSFGDGGAAFVLKLANTTGFGKFILDVDMLLLRAEGRSNSFVCDFGVSPDGSSPPTSFTIVSNDFFGSIPTNVAPAASTFGAYHRTLDFGSLMDNQPGPIWVRIRNLASTGSNSRATVGVDNYSLTYSNVAAATLPPVITTQPATNSTVYLGDSFSLNVANSGTAPFTYQWYKDNFSTPVGSGTATLLFPSVTAADAGTYYVVISNVAGAVTNNPPAIVNFGTRVPIVTTIYNLRTNLDLSNGTPPDTTNYYTVKGVVFTRVNMTTAANASFYIEDTNTLAGIDVFIAGDTTTRPAYGDIIEVTGPLGSFNGVLEFNLNSANPTHIVSNLGASGYTVPPKLFSDLAAPSALIETNYEGSFVVVSNVVIQYGGTGTNFTSASGGFFITNQANQTFTLFIDSRLTDIVGTPIPGCTVNIAGYISQFDSTAPYTSSYQLVPTYLADITTNAPVVVPPAPTAETVTNTISGNSLILSWGQTNWTGLLTGTNITAITNELPGVTSPYTNALSGPQNYFRLYYKP